ncbi:unnamed protein product, partial [Prunus brigantina]
LTTSVVIVVLPFHPVADSVGVDSSLSSILMVAFPCVSFCSFVVCQGLRWGWVDLFRLVAQDYRFYPRIPLLSLCCRCLGVIFKGRWIWFGCCLRRVLAF